MRLFGRHDALLAAGLATSLIVVFSGPVARLLDYAEAVERAFGLRLLPALVILAFVFVLQQLWKRQEWRARTLASQAAAQEATERASDMAQLVSFGEALTRSLDSESIRAAALAHLPLLVPGRGVWVLLLSDASWSTLVAVNAPPLATRERAASAALGVSHAAPAAEPSDPHSHSAGTFDDICFPMLAADAPVGVLGVSAEPALTSHHHNMLATAAALLGVALRNAEMLREIRENSVRDALTGCVNRAHMLEVLSAELGRTRRTNAPISIVMFDLDYFKSVNDRYGHLCGDAVLASIGSLMRELLRTSDVKCRYGGEEFLIVLFDTRLDGARHVANTLRRQLELRRVRWQQHTVAVTASFGITTVLPGETDPMSVLARADDALYRAKQAGRNCVRQVTERAAAGALPGLRLAR